jgi:hypothetical protein
VSLAKNSEMSLQLPSQLCYSMINPTLYNTNGTMDLGVYYSWKKEQAKDVHYCLYLLLLLSYNFSNPSMNSYLNAWLNNLPLATKAMKDTEAYPTFSVLLTISHPAFTFLTSTFSVNRSNPKDLQLDALSTHTRLEYSLHATSLPSFQY